MAAQAVVEESDMVGNITAKIQAMNCEVERLENVVRMGSVDARVLVEFREAMNHARRATAAVKKWVDEEAKHGGDPYQAVQLMISERVRITTQLVQDLARDVECGDVDFGTPGLSGLHASVKTLKDRLARFGK